MQKWVIFIHTHLPALNGKFKAGPAIECALCCLLPRRAAYMRAAEPEDGASPASAGLLRESETCISTSCPRCVQVIF